MQRPIGRRRYAALLKFLNETLTDVSVPRGERLKAATTLATVLTERDKANEQHRLSLARAVARKVTAETRRLELELAERGIRIAAQVVEDAGEGESEDTAEDRATQAVWNRVLREPN